jgi:hypothetical protein
LASLLGWFVQHPLRILALVAIYVAAWALLRRSRAGRKADALLWPAAFCAAFAAWEWLVLLRTPEADIRFDLLLIWPVLLIATVWALWRTFRR